MRPFTFLYAIFAIFFAVVGAREDRAARLKRQLAARQNQNAPFNGPTTVTTTRTAETFAGTVIETCTIKLTPITVNGQNAVQEERNCTTQLVKSSSTVVAGTSTGVSTSTIQPQTTSVSTVVVTATVTGTSAATTSTASVSSTSVATTTSASSSSTAATSTTSSSASQSTTTSLATSTSAVSSTSSSAPLSTSSSTSSSASSATTSAVSSSVSSAASSTSTSAAASSTITSSAATSTTVVGGPAKEIGMETKSGSSLPPATTTPAAVSVSTTATATSATTSVSAAAAEASASATPFTLPGKKLEVLPIGLGVFAGISVIALIVVGLVTYERTKYRKAFRQRKLAEQGAGMGYSGMSERV